MTPNYPLPKDLQRKIEQEANDKAKICANGSMNMDHYSDMAQYNALESGYKEGYADGATPYARKLDIALKALDDIRDVGDSMAVDIARTALQNLKRLDNGE